ncbi:hypothetical protein ILYODFUR_003755 [Ilyodon furcidens]|uniref:Uncharacterized protein n=1 Tax=Ilyodon furcidens TaxID=33524 RepID=A0ABV0SV87_9TELE
MARLAQDDGMAILPSRLQVTRGRPAAAELRDSSHSHHPNWEQMTQEFPVSVGGRQSLCARKHSEMTPVVFLRTVVALYLLLSPVQLEYLSAAL